MRLRRRARGEKGFTLIELLVASAVFAVGMLGVLKMLHMGIVSYRYSKDLSTANALLQKQLEMVSREAFNSVVNGTAGGSVVFYDNGTNGDATNGDGIFTRQITQNSKVYTCTLRRQTDSPRAGIETITGTMSWTDMGGAAVRTSQKTRSVSFVTYKNT
jgi:prepilin-type N-terminal cleavage/methylation domain-containing protein